MPGEMLSPDELDQMGDVSGPVLYRAEVQRMPYLTPEERDGYIEAAHSGDVAARNQLITDCLHFVLYKASVTYHEWRPPHSDMMDLVGHAHVKLLEAFPKALAADQPIKYLLSIAALEMKLYCLYDDPMVQRPRSRPFDRDHPRTVSIEAAPEVPIKASEPVPDAAYRLVYDAVQDLSEQRQQIITAAYGLFGQATLDIEDIAAQRQLQKNSVRSYVSKAKTKLAEKLGPYVLEKRLQTHHRS